MLSEAKELLVVYMGQTYPPMSVYRQTVDWLARYEHRQEMVVRVFDDLSYKNRWGDVGDLPFEMQSIMGFATKELALADAKRVADELGLRMKVEGE